MSDLIIAIFMYMIIYVDSFLYRRNSNGIEPWNMSNPAVLPVQRGPAVSSKFANKHANFNASHSGCSQIVWPATLSHNTCTKQHLPIVPTMADNPEAKELSPNPPSAFTPVIPVRDIEKDSLKTNQIELSSFTPSDRSFKTVLTKHSIIHSNVPTRSKSVSSVGRQVKYLSLLLDGYYILCLLIVIPGVVRNPPKKKLPESQVGVR